MSTCLVSYSDQKHQLQIPSCPSEVLPRRPPPPQPPVTLAPTGSCTSPDALYLLVKFLFLCPLESSGSLRLAKVSLIPRCWSLWCSKLPASWNVCPVSRCGASLARGPRGLGGDLFCLSRLGVGTACLGAGLSCALCTAWGTWEGLQVLL